jgi:hypothetical protein
LLDFEQLTLINNNNLFERIRYYCGDGAVTKDETKMKLKVKVKLKVITTVITDVQTRQKPSFKTSST